MIKSIIVAKTKNNVIGLHNQMPWHLPNDLKHFKQTTLGHLVIMGRKTWESLPKPLSDRKLIVITHQPHYQSTGCMIATSLQEALKIAKESGETEVFIAGGGTIYQEALPIVDQLYLTEIQASILGDTFFPPLIPHTWQEVSRRSHQIDAKHAYAYDFVRLIRKHP